MKLINIGFGNLVSAGRVVAVVSPDSAPVKRLVKEARERGMLIDASYGRSTRAVLIMDSDHVVLSALTPETVASRAAGQPEGKPTEGSKKLENEKYLFVVSGAAGTGKDSVVKALREAHPEIEKTVSATTRAPRPGDRRGLDYYYRTREQFRHLIDTDQVVEHNFYNGNYYGTLREEVDKRLEAASWWCWSSTSTARPISAGCSRGLPPSSCCRPPWRSWNAASGAAHRDGSQHPRAPRHRKEGAGPAGEVHPHPRERRGGRLRREALRHHPPAGRPRQITRSRECQKR